MDYAKLSDIRLGEEDGRVSSMCRFSLDKMINGNVDIDGSFINTEVSGWTQRATSSTLSKKDCIKSCYDADDDVCKAVSFHGIDGTGNTGTCLIFYGGGTMDYIQSDIPNNTSWSYIKSGIPSHCKTICDESTDIPDWCDSAFRTPCSTNIKHDICQRWCSRNDVNCDSEISKYCYSLSTDKAKEDRLCGCFMKPDFYNNFYDDLSKKIKINANITQPRCTYPPCSSSIAVPYAIKQGEKCPDILNCIQVVNVDNQGKIEGDLVISEEEKCSQAIQKLDPSPPDIKSQLMGYIKTIKSSGNIDSDKLKSNSEELSQKLLDYSDCDMKDFTSLKPCVDFVPYICSESGIKDFCEGSQDPKLCNGTISKYPEGAPDVYNFDCSKIRKSTISPDDSVNIWYFIVPAVLLLFISIFIIIKRKKLF